MGLDTFASRTSERIQLTEEDEAAFEEAKPELCGGIESGGWDAFRGKVYVEVVEHVTGVLLSEPWIPPETVREMAEAFEACDPLEVAEVAERELTYDTSPHEIVELGRFFRICADRGLGLVAWS